MADTEFFDGSYLSRSWRMLTQDEGWYKPIMVLALVAFVPLIGPIGILGYELGWARLTAWGIDSAPKQTRVNVGACIAGGWKAFVVGLGWGIVGTLLAWLCIALLGPWILWLVWFGLAIYSLVCCVAMLRSAIYQHIGPGYGLSQIFDMAGRDFGGIMRIFLIELLRVAINFAVMLAILLIVGFALAGPLAQLATIYYYGGASREFLISSALDLTLSAIAWVGPLAIVCAYIEGLISTTFDLIIFNALGLWIRQFDVPAWGGPAEPVPPSIPSAEPPSPYGAPHGGHPGGPFAGGPADDRFDGASAAVQGYNPQETPKGASPMTAPTSENPAGAPFAPEETPSSPDYVGEPVTPPTPKDLYHDATAETTHWTDVVSPTPDATFHMAWPEGGATQEPPTPADDGGVRPPTPPELYTEVSGEVAREWPDIDLRTGDATPTMDTPEVAAEVNAAIAAEAKAEGVRPPAPEVAAKPRAAEPAPEVEQTPVTPPTPRDLYHEAAVETARWTEVVTPPLPGTGSLGRPKIERTVNPPIPKDDGGVTPPAAADLYDGVATRVAKTWPDVDLQSRDAVPSIDSPEVKEVVDEAIAAEEADGTVEHLIRPKED